MDKTDASNTKRGEDSANGSGRREKREEPGLPRQPLGLDRNENHWKVGGYGETVRIVTRKVHSSLDLDDVMDSAVDVMNKHIETAENVSIYMVEGDTAVLKSYRGYPDCYMDKLAAIPYPRGFTWKTILESRPTYCPDVDCDTVIGPLGRALGTKSYVSMPIRYSGRAIGCININSVRKNAFDQGELDLLEIVATSIEAAINNARRAEALKKSREALRENNVKLRRKNRFEKVINAVTRSVHQSLEVSEVFENAVDAIYNEVGEAQHVLIYMVESSAADDKSPHAVMKAQRGHPDSFIDLVKRIPYPLGATWKTIMDGKPRFVSDGDLDPHLGKAGREYGARSYVSVPIKLEDDTVGCIHIHSFRKHAFNKDHLKLLDSVVGQLETAISNARKTEALRRSEEALRKTRDELEGRVRERTSELQKSNTLLIKEILERRYVENELKLSLAEKDVLLKEIHHRVKNNLQIISSLLNLQSRKLKDEKALASFVESNNRIRSIATLHEQLYRSKDLSRIDFRAHMRNMTNHLLRSYGMGSDHIRVVIDSEQIYLDINTAIPLGLVVNELVSNAIKHGFDGRTSGEIRIEFRRTLDKYTLSVSNDGIRLPEDFDIDSSTTLGLELVSSLSKQLKGAITVSSGDVTEFRLEFKA
ncbi:MAG TPA: GAF domain-containing protein [Thermodesulfobacteriota bacterium]|nr:GAF domain-containing protein [Thermodesulfobacteriota bacterium]